MDIKNKKTYNILSCLKQVPDERELGTDKETGSLLRDNAGSIPNPADSDNLELALLLKERIKDLGFFTNTIALTMGPTPARASLRQALALGFDRAIQLRDKEFAGSDVLMTAKSLSLAIKALEKSPDFVFCGESSSDGDTGELAAELSAFLGYNFLAKVKEIISLEDGKLRVYTEEDSIIKEVEADLPLVLQVKFSSQKPRFASFRDRMEAKKKPLEIWTKKDLLGLDDQMDLGYKGSPTKIRKIAPPVFNRSPIRLKLEDYPNFPKELLYRKDPKTYLKNFIKDIKGEEDFCHKKSLLKAKLSDKETPPKESLAIIVIKEKKEYFTYSLELISKLQAIGDFPIEIWSVEDPSCKKENKEEKELKDKILANVDKWKVYHSKHLLSSFETAQILAKKIGEEKATLLILPATDWGRDLGPQIAARLETGMTAGVTDLSYKNSQWEQVRPAYGGMVLATVITPAHRPIMMTIQPNVFRIELNNNRKAIKEDYYINEEAKRPVKILSTKKANLENIFLDQAERIMVLGGGFTEKEDLKIFTDLAKARGYEWAVTRPLVTAYLSAHQRQVGVSGRSLKPDIALLIGVSGSSQTMSGLSQSGIIVAINNDPKAKIFDQVDLAFVGSYQDFLKALKN